MGEMPAEKKKEQRDLCKQQGSADKPNIHQRATGTSCHFFVLFTRILSSLQFGVAHNLVANQVKVGVLDTGLVQKLSPFLWLLLFAIGFFLAIYFECQDNEREIMIRTEEMS